MCAKQGTPMSICPQHQWMYMGQMKKPSSRPCLHNWWEIWPVSKAKPHNTIILTNIPTIAQMKEMMRQPCRKDVRLPEVIVRIRAAQPEVSGARASELPRMPSMVNQIILIRYLMCVSTNRFDRKQEFRSSRSKETTASSPKISNLECEVKRFWENVPVTRNPPRRSRAKHPSQFVNSLFFSPKASRWHTIA